MAEVGEVIEVIDLNCPLCGGPPERVFNAFYGDQSMVRCRQCGATAYHSKWNSRVTYQKSDAEIGNLIDRMRYLASSRHWRSEADATACADALSTLLSERDELREALRPFLFGDPTMEQILFGHLADDATGTFTMKLGDLRRARKVIDK